MEDSKVKLDFACSGAADVGELSDRAARILHRKVREKCIVYPELALK